MNKSVVLIGYHGKDNLGDDIFRRVLLNAINSHTTVSKVKILVAEGGNIDEVQHHDLVTQAFKVPRWLPGRLRWLTVYCYALNASGMLFGAGSLFTKQAFTEILWVVKLRKKLSHTPFPVVALGVSVGPFATEKIRNSCFSLLRKFDNVLLRDFDSAKRLQKQQEINAVQGYDLALAYADLPVVQPKHSEEWVIGVSVTTRAFPDWQQNSRSIDDFCTRLSESSFQGSKLVFRIIVACMNPKDGDYDLSVRVARKLEQAGCTTELVEHHDKTLETTLLKIGSCDALIAARMHVGIVGLLYQLPIIQISYEEKICAFYNRHELSTDYLLDLDNASSELLTNGIHDILSGNHDSFPYFNDSQLAQFHQLITRQVKANLQPFS